MIIGVDFDDVLHNFTDGMLAFYNAKYATHFSRADMTRYYFQDVVGKSFKEVYPDFNNFCFTEDHKVAEPIAGAKDAITKLAKKHKLIVITARPEELREATQTWLDLHFPNIFHEIHFTRNTWEDTTAQKKSAIALKLGVEYFIEDSLDNAKDICGVGIPVFLLNAPWNQGELPEKVIRVNAWQEIPRMLS